MVTTSLLWAVFFLGENGQLRGAEAGLVAIGCFGSEHLHLVLKANFFGFRPDPGIARFGVPHAAVIVGKAEFGCQDTERLAFRVAFQIRRFQGEGFLALLVERRHFKVVQHVVRTGRAFGFNLGLGAKVPDRNRG